MNSVVRIFLTLALTFSSMIFCHHNFRDIAGSIGKFIMSRSALVSTPEQVFMHQNNLKLVWQESQQA